MRRRIQAMTLPEFSPVRLITDHYLSPEGVGRGAVGVILDAFSDGYYVEFSRPDGTTIAWFFWNRLTSSQRPR
jgi:hypothetical protein